MSGPPADETGSETPSFEQSSTRLQQIVEQLESGKLSLEESLALFEEGVGVARSAQERLDLAERRIEELLAVDEEGAAKTRPFETQ